MTPPLIPGEEWRNVHELDRHHLKHLRPDAEVLAQAREGIERHRKSDLRLRLVDASGQPRRGLELRLVQERHHFVFGCSSGGTFAGEDSPNVRARNRHFVALFNGTHAKCYWDEKWHQPIETHQGHRNTSLFLAEIDWACAHGLVVRGHPLVWTVPKAIPQWVRTYTYDQQLRFMEHNLRSLIQCADGRIKLWDLVNEMLWEPSLRNLAARDWPHIESTEEMLTYMEPAMHWAREEDPDGRYVINDYGLERTYTELKGVNGPMQRRRFVELAVEMRRRGCGPDALGTQGHVGKWFPMDLAWKVFDELSEAGLPLQISEFWAGLKDHPDPAEKSEEQLRIDRARYAADYYTVAFGHPSVEHLSWWGGAEFFEREGWVTSLLYQQLHRLIREEWWSDVTLTTDGDGCLDARVFHGDYRLRWRGTDGTLHSQPVRVEPGRSQEGTLVLG